MSVLEHERPGVYSTYDASAVVSAGQATKIIGVAAKAVKGTEKEPVTVTGYTAGVEAFGEDAETPPLRRKPCKSSRVNSPLTNFHGSSLVR